MAKFGSQREPSPERMPRSRVYVIGLALAGMLTWASIAVAGAHDLWGPSVPIALSVLAIAQMGIHLVFFLHITTAPDQTNNVMALVFGILIVGLVIGGSMWIVGHLNANMMSSGNMSMRGF